jgi:hypothetical protein
MRETPVRLIVEPNLPTHRRESELPAATKSRTHMADPSLAKVRKLKLEPISTALITDIPKTEPILERPITEREDPNRTNCRTDNELPVCVKSRIDREEPSLE